MLAKASPKRELGERASLSVWACCGATTDRRRCAPCFAKYAAARDAPARNVELDDYLRDWRVANPGSIVRVAQDGVYLYPFGDDPMHFADADEALEFLTRPRRRAS